MPKIEIDDDFFNSGEGLYQITFKKEEGKISIIDKITAEQFKNEEKEIAKENEEREKEELNQKKKSEVSEPLEESKVKDRYKLFREIKEKEEELKKMQEENKEGDSADNE